MNKAIDKTIIDVKNLSVYYGNCRVAHDISFTLREGETLAIVGESGSGKSTVLKAMMGLLDNGGRAEGSIKFHGDEVLNMTHDELKKIRGDKIAMIFQNAAASFCPIRKIGEQIAEGIKAHRNLDDSEIRSRADELMGILSLDESTWDAYPFRLSGGMGQRMGILSAMVLRPSVLLCDEPTSALDSVTQKAVASLLVRAKGTGTSLIVITHNMGLAHYIADNVLVMNKGEMVEIGSRDEIFGSPREQYTRRLIDAVPRLCKACA